MGLTSLNNVLKGMTNEQLQTRYDSGRGRGDRETYQPWLMVREVKSRGQSYVEPGWIVNRGHHLLSGWERIAFLAMQRLPGVSDIREQFPLWPLESTEEIAAELGIRHPRVPNSSYNNLMTTDLVLTTDWEGGPLIPIHVKPALELSEKRNQEKLDIEMEWWRRQGARLRVVTERELPNALCVNLSAMAGYRKITVETVGNVPLEEVVAAFLASVGKNPDRPANRLGHDLDNALGLEAGVCLAVFWHLVANGRLRMDLFAPFDPTAPFRFEPGNAT